MYQFYGFVLIWGVLNLAQYSKRFRPLPPLSRLHPKRRGGGVSPDASARPRLSLVDSLSLRPSYLDLLVHGPAALPSVQCRPEFRWRPVRRFALGGSPLLPMTPATRACEPFHSSLPRRRRSPQWQYPAVAIPAGRPQGAPRSGGPFCHRNV